jgi:hypothetical protein
MIVTSTVTMVSELPSGLERCPRIVLCSSYRESNDLPQALPDKDLGKHPAKGAAESGAASKGMGSHGLAEDTDLARVIEAWPRLPEQVRRATLEQLPGFDASFEDWVTPRRRGRRLVDSQIPITRVDAISSGGKPNGHAEQQDDRSRSTGVIVRADTSADNERKKVTPLADNQDVIQLAKKINAERGSGASMNEIAPQFAEGNPTLAASLLRQLRRYKHLLE